MDPLTLCSLFCNTITIVQAAVQTTAALKELYDSATGFSTAHKRIRTEVDLLETISTDLTGAQAKLESCPQQDQLAKVGDECGTIAKQIRIVLDKCKIDSVGPRPLAVAKAWIKSKTRASEIEELKLGIESCQRRLGLAITAALR